MIVQRVNQALILARLAAVSIVATAALPVVPRATNGQAAPQTVDSLARSRVQLVASPAAPDPKLGDALLVGRVTTLGEPVALFGAEISIGGTTRVRYADTSGSFRTLAVPAGTQEVLVRRLGFEPARVTVAFEAGRQYTLSASLKRLAAVLTEVRIEGVKRFVPPYLEDAYRRGASGFGKFITAEEIDAMGAMDVTSVMLRVPGVHGASTKRGFAFIRCGGYGWEAAGWGSAKVQVYIDGVRVSLEQPPGDPKRAFFPVDPVAEALTTVNIKQIQAIEVYTGVARIPAEFLSDACAVVAIWTKRG